MTDVSALEKKIDRVLRALEGDEEMGQQGIVGRLGQVESRVGMIELERRDEAAQKKGALWVVGVASTVAASVGAFITWAAGFINNSPKP